MLDELYLKDMYIILYLMFSPQVELTLEGIKFINITLCNH